MFKNLITRLISKKEEVKALPPSKDTTWYKDKIASLNKSYTPPKFSASSKVHAHAVTNKNQYMETTKAEKEKAINIFLQESKLKIEAKQVVFNEEIKPCARWILAKAVKKREGDLMYVDLEGNVKNYRDEFGYPFPANSWITLYCTKILRKGTNFRNIFYTR